ncbi:hypothetical protein GE09DRAFT_1051266 [Coniochaeta sp. 2T2.1]|nr:hypothetical protein GE09DRAFT_1051266 [Coniochaeta sp. 2T2.1]
MSQTPFSYAQAAKGQTTPQTTPQPTTSPAPPSVSSQGKDDATTTSTAATVLSTTSAEIDLNDSAKQSKTDDEPVSRKPQTETPLPEPTTASRRVSNTTSNVATNGVSAPAEPAKSAATEEKRRRSPSRTPRSTDGEARKGRKGKKGRNHDKEGDADKAQDDKEDKEPAKAPVILSEAPIPSVNIWHKRKEAHAAKAKAPASGSQNAAPAHAAQVDDSKKRTSAEEDDTQTGTQNGTNGEKAQQRKSVDSSRLAEQLPRRSAPRGSRAPEKDEKSGAESLPPVADAALWPDVKSAVAADEGKKPQEKAERVEKDTQDGTAPSKRNKKEWVAIPYVPTVNFQTQLPQRSSKPRGGARGGREAGTTRAANTNSSNASGAPVTTPTADKTQSTTNTGPAKDGRPREGSGSARANSLPPSASKRASIDANLVRDARKPSAPASTDRPRDPALDSQSQSGAAKAENGRVGRRDSNPPSSEQQSQFASRNLPDRRGEAGFKGYEGFKDAGISAPKEQNLAARERSEGQGRGRGGYRGRGGHNASVSGAHQQNGFVPNGQYAVHPIPGRQNGPYSPPAQQNTFGNAYPGGSSRGGGRGSGRGGSGSANYSRVNSNGAGPGRMAPVNTGNVPYDFSMPQYGAYPPMPPVPVYDNGAISLLTAQIEYYFSMENLIKDTWLRRNMDSQGFVPFDLIAGFTRVSEMAPDAEHVRIACEVSDKLDYVYGEDGVERLRVRDQWNSWVYPLEQRLEKAQNDGPRSIIFRSRHSSQQYPPAAPMMPVGYPATSPTMFPGNFPPEEQMYPQPYMNGAHYDAGMNGGDMVNGHRYAPETQLSAAVPEFAPSGVQVGGVQQPPFTLEGATTFSDERVEDLMVVVTDDKKEASASSGPPEAAVVNGTNGADSTPAEVKSPKNIVWAENQTLSLGPNQVEVRYVDLRKKAFEKRAAKAGEASRDMQNLYNFWAHFLVHDFNATMYDEFRSCALEDARAKENPAAVSDYGLKYLLQFYNEMLHGDMPKPWGKDRPVPEIINLHHQGALEAKHSYRANSETRM